MSECMYDQHMKPDFLPGSVIECIDGQLRFKQGEVYTVLSTIEDGFYSDGCTAYSVQLLFPDGSVRKNYLAYLFRALNTSKN